MVELREAHNVLQSGCCAPVLSEGQTLGMQAHAVLRKRRHVVHDRVCQNVRQLLGALKRHAMVDAHHEHALARRVLQRALSTAKPGVLEVGANNLLGQEHCSHGFRSRGGIRWVGKLAVRKERASDHVDGVHGHNEFVTRATPPPPAWTISPRR